jgi:hypothetical protein
MAKTSIRDKALAAVPPETLEDVPEWDNAKVLVVGLSLHEQQEFLRSLTVKDHISGELVELPDRNERLQIQLLIRTLKDPETREAVFTQADAQALRDMAAAPLARLFAAASRVSGLGSDRDTQETESRLEADPTAGSS